MISLLIGLAAVATAVYAWRKMETPRTRSMREKCRADVEAYRRRKAQEKLPTKLLTEQDLIDRAAKRNHR